MPATPAILSGTDSRPAPGLVLGCALGAGLLGLAGVALASWPTAGPLGASYAIVLLHVPAAWLSLLLYAAAAGCAALTLSQPGAFAGRLLHALAQVGVAAALVALWSGLGGQLALGAWWGWDARLVCVVVLLALYLGVVALYALVADRTRADRIAAVLVLVGALNIPAIYLSVSWWHTLHERAAASVGRSSFAVAAMVAMTLAFCMFAAAVVLARLEYGAPKEQE